jgi:hypothetical protein
MTPIDFAIKHCADRRDEAEAHAFQHFGLRCRPIAVRGTSVVIERCKLQD